MLICFSPLRISFAGGGTDMPEYYESFVGKVVTTTITKYVYVISKESHDDSFQTFSSDLKSHQQSKNFQDLKPTYGSEISTSVIKYFDYKKGTNIMISSDAPAGSGLGASGSLAVNLVKTISTLKGQDLSKNQLAEKAYHVGRNVLQWPIGKQDEYASAFGGINFLTFEKEKTKVEPINLSSSTIKELEQNILLFFVGKTRNSSNILSEEIKKIEKKNSDIISALDTAKKLAESTYDSLKNNDITKFGEILHQGWTAKKKFVSGVSDETIDKVYETALNYGALGGKLTGAGGGGHMVLYCEKEKQNKLISKMEELGLKNIEFEFEKRGPRLVNLYDFAKG